MSFKNLRFYSYLYFFEFLSFVPILTILLTSVIPKLFLDHQLILKFRCKLMDP